MMITQRAGELRTLNAAGLQVGREDFLPRQLRRREMMQAYKRRLLSRFHPPFSMWPSHLTSMAALSITYSAAGRSIQHIAHWRNPQRSRWSNDWPPGRLTAGLQVAAPIQNKNTDDCRHPDGR